MNARIDAGGTTSSVLPVEVALPEPFNDGSTLIRANGIDLAYQSFGDRLHPALLLVMGLGAQMIGWDEGFCRMLAACGYHVIRFDNRDVGRSTCLHGAAVPNRFALLATALRGRPLKVLYTLRDMADDSIGLLDALGIARAHVVGASLGSAIGQEMAIHHPHRLSSFTSIMGMTGNMRVLRPGREALAVLFTRAATTEAGYIASSRLAWRVMRVGHYPDEEARDTHRARLAWLRGYNPNGKLRQLAAFLASGNRSPALRALSVPTLVIHGDVDPLVPLAAGKETAAVIPDAHLHVIAGMGHALPMPIWNEIVEAIARHAR
ncbi:MAG: alpha/beta fold hydrolase [Burkholderiaceae bacterium]